MSQGTVILVATHNKHLPSHIDRKVKCVGMSAVAVPPVAEAIQQHVAEAQSRVVIIDAHQSIPDALTLARLLADTCPMVKVVILGRNNDLSLVAHALVARVSEVLLDTTPMEEFGDAIARLLAGKPASEESLLGRVRANFPVPTGEADRFTTACGHRLTTEEAITRCDQFGLTADEIGSHLGVPLTSVEQITRKARTSPKPSLVSDALSSILPDANGASVDLLSLRNTVAVLAILAVAWATMSFARKRPLLDRFVSLKGTAIYEDGRPLAKDTALMFGLQSGDGTVPPAYCGVARIEDATGGFSTTLRLGKNDAQPYTFKVAILGPSLLPMDSEALPSDFSDLATTPLRVAYSEQDIRIRCPLAKSN